MANQPNITRRAALVGALVSSVALAVPVAASVKQSPVFEPLELAADRRSSVRPVRPPFMDMAIAKHKKAHASLEDGCNAADSMHPDYGGPKAEARWDRLDRAEDRALTKLMGTSAYTTIEARAKSEYLLAYSRRNELQPHHIEALLRSLA